MLPMVVIPKKIVKSFNEMAFFRINASGIDRVTVEVMNASPVPIGTPFDTSAWIMGITLIELAYRGTPTKTANGTDKNSFPESTLPTRSSGIKP